MLWHIKLPRISSGLWICRSHSIWWKFDFCQLYNLTAGCNFNNQLLFSAFCLASVGWIKTNGVIYIPIVFCPLTVEYSDMKYYHNISILTSSRPALPTMFICWDLALRFCRGILSDLLYPSKKEIRILWSPYINLLVFFLMRACVDIDNSFDRTF